MLDTICTELNGRRVLLKDSGQKKTLVQGDSCIFVRIINEENNESGRDTVALL